jgi:ribosomal protein L37AE/L43A
MANKDNQEAKWEFGSLEWCQFAAETGIRLIKEANLDLGKYNWGFSEEYTHIPKRLLAGRDKAGFQFMIKDGKVSGGASLTEECLALPGFHVSVDWALIAHASAVEYDLEGQRKRGADAAVLNAELEAAGYGSKKSAEQATEKPAEKREPRCPVCGSPDHDRENCPVWPPGIGEALAAGASEGGGLHNLTAKRLRRSPELDDLPETEYGVPIFTKMTDKQKERFIKLLGR